MWFDSYLAINRRFQHAIRLLPCYWPPLPACDSTPTLLLTAASSMWFDSYLAIDRCFQHVIRLLQLPAHCIPGRALYSTQGWGIKGLTCIFTESSIQIMGSKCSKVCGNFPLFWLIFCFPDPFQDPFHESDPKCTNMSCSYIAFLFSTKNTTITFKFFNFQRKF